MSDVSKQRWWDLHNPYAYRNDNLKRMGFPSYRAYLKSNLWKSIRDRVLTANRICRACASRAATQVHHRAYDPATLSGENIEALSAVCARCHKKGEKPNWTNQNAHERLMWMNQSALRRTHRAQQREWDGFEPSDARLVWDRPKAAKPRKRKHAAFVTDMTPRLRKAERAHGAHD